MQINLRVNQLNLGSVGTSRPTLTLNKPPPLPEYQAQVFGKRKHCTTASLNVLPVGLRTIHKASQI